MLTILRLCRFHIAEYSENSKTRVHEFCPKNETDLAKSLNLDTFMSEHHPVEHN